MLGQAQARLGLIAAVVFATWATWSNQFRFFINPDSYYYLLIAKNLVTSGHPTGTLGPAGMPFPPQGYAAMKATFPLLAALPMALGLTPEAAGHLVSSLAFVACVPLAFVATRRLLESDGAALVAAALVATSWGLVYWSGFVMSDSTSAALAFALLALVACNRPRELMNPGDLATGVVAALLLLSRPTYAVAIPMLLWIGYRRHDWNGPRLATAAVSAALLVSAVSVAWFPPAAFGAGVALRLTPILLAAAVLSALSMWLLSSHSRGATALYWLAALAVPVAVLAGFALYARGLGPSPSGLANFGARDVAVLALLIPGAAALRRSSADTAGGLLVSAAALLFTYLWADARESRYLIHLLPVITPVAAGVALISGRRFARIGLALALVAVCWQGVRIARGSSATFLDTDYPTQVVARMGDDAETPELLVTALPWPYHFRTGLSTWNAEPSTIARFTRYIPEETYVRVLADAALLYHDGPLASALASDESARVIASFEVPRNYTYGYVGVPHEEPVRIYRLKAKDLRRVAAAVADIETPDRDAESEIR